MGEIDKQLHSAKEEEQIEQMFLSGSVMGDNVSYWNSELSAARSARVTLEKQLAVTIALPILDRNAILPDLMKAAGVWARRCLDDSATYETEPYYVCG